MGGRKNLEKATKKKERRRADRQLGRIGLIQPLGRTSLPPRGLTRTSEQ